MFFKLCIELWDFVVHDISIKTQNKQHKKTGNNNKFITLTYINNHIQQITHKFKNVTYKIAFRPQKNAEQPKNIQTNIQI